MPNYYNPYNLYPATYANQAGYNMMPMAQQNPMMQQSYAPQSQADEMKWVEGELGAKMFQMPMNWPANKVIMLWDSTDTNIFLKSWGPMGIPNPIQKLHYTMETTQPDQQMLPNGNGNSQASAPDMSQYVTKADLEKMIAEMKNTSGNHSYNQGGQGNQNNQNGSNRGGNK